MRARRLVLDAAKQNVVFVELVVAQQVSESVQVPAAGLSVRLRMV